MYLVLVGESTTEEPRRHSQERQRTGERAVRRLQRKQHLRPIGHGGEGSNIHLYPANCQLASTS